MLLMILTIITMIMMISIITIMLIIIIMVMTVMVIQKMIIIITTITSSLSVFIFSLFIRDSYALLLSMQVLQPVLQAHQGPFKLEQCSYSEIVNSNITLTLISQRTISLTIRKVGRIAYISKPLYSPCSHLKIVVGYNGSVEYIFSVRCVKA